MRVWGSLVVVGQSSLLAFLALDVHEATGRSLASASLLVVVALAGASVVGFQGLWITMLAELAPAGRVGATTGFAITFTVTAVTLTPPVLGLVADLAGTYRAIWVVLSGLLALAFIPAVLVHEPRDRLAS